MSVANYDPDAMANLAEDDDDSLVLDLSGVDENESGFRPIPAGTYDAIVYSVEYGKSKAGNPMLTWVFSVQHDGMERRLWYWTTNTEKTRARLKKTLVVLAPDLDLKKFHMRNDTMQLVGRPCTLKVGVKPYNGEARNEVKDVLPPRNAEGNLDFLDHLG